MTPNHYVASLLHYLRARGCTESNQVQVDAVFERHISTAISANLVRAGGPKDTDDYRRVTFTAEGLRRVSDSLNAFSVDHGDKFAGAVRIRPASVLRSA